MPSSDSGHHPPQPVQTTPTANDGLLRTCVALTSVKKVSCFGHMLPSPFRVIQASVFHSQAHPAISLTTVYISNKSFINRVCVCLLPRVYPPPFLALLRPLLFADGVGTVSPRMQVGVYADEDAGRCVYR